MKSISILIEPLEAFLTSSISEILLQLAARANGEVDKTTKYLAVLSLLDHEQLCYWLVNGGYEMEGGGASLHSFGSSANGSILIAGLFIGPMQQGGGYVTRQETMSIHAMRFMRD
ncbi:hypothetical protein IFM89_013001 [Coptis chinensis]|uniref:Uncharacterized protein n=1 Tax=Coptis chinensis TaxID=261450 RepID=A0A835GZ12_9MAGN|nr:hypothetical protein IFM89_013001 [Coptis chinensis]